MNTKSLIIKYIALILIASLPLYSQNADTGERTLKAVVSPNKGTVGQTFEYSLSIAGKNLDGIKVELPSKGEIFPEEKKDKEKAAGKVDAKPEDEKAVPLFIIHNAAKDLSESEGLKQINVKVQLTCYMPGTHPLPEINITDTDGVKIGYSIPSVTIEELNKEGKPEDIEPPIELSGNYTRIIIVILSIIAAAVAGFFLYRYWKKRRKQKVKTEPEQTPMEFFISEVERLRLRECIAKGDVHEYVFGISITFRRFLSMALGFDAAEMTTGEISSVLKKYFADAGRKGFADEILSFMDIWDLSKFAEFTLSKEILSVNLDSVISAAEKIQELGRADNGAV